MKKLISVFLILLVIYPLSSQEKKIWMIFEEAKILFENQDYGEAFRLFRDCREKRGIYPEAEMWIGEIYEIEGEYSLAEKQYLKAISEKDFLYTPSELISFKYKLAELYRKTRDYNNMEEILLDIAADNEIFSDSEYLSYQKSMISSLENKGLTNVMELFRFSAKEQYKAHKILGEYYYYTGRYYNSLLQLSFAVVSSLTMMIEYLNIKSPDYEYTNIESIFKYAERDNFLKNYINDSELFRSLYYLGSVIFAKGNLAQAKEIWMVLLKYDINNIWGQKANLQYSAPFIEPVLSADDYF